MALVGPIPRFLLASLALAAVLGGAGGALFGVCGPFTDVSDAAFCPFVLEIFTLGITTGTTPTTYDPASSVTRLQMAAFLSRTVDGVVKRGSRRAALGRFWNPQNESVLAQTTVGGSPRHPRSDGVDVWVPNRSIGTVSRVRAGDGKLLETWTGATTPSAVVIAAGRIVVCGGGVPGRLYTIDPTQAAGAVTQVASNLPSGCNGMAFDGARFWTANPSISSVSIVTPGAIPWTATTVTAGLIGPNDILFDGASIWTADSALNRVYRLDPAGDILQTVTIPVVDPRPTNLVFDGANIWVTNRNEDSVTVFRASSGAILRTLTGNGVKDPNGIAFDGERVLVANIDGETLSLWKAADLAPLGSFLMPGGSQPFGACSDGTSFWITFLGTDKLARF